MKINTTQSQGMASYTVAAKKSVEKTSSSSEESAAVAASSSVTSFPTDLERIKDMVKRLNSESNIRPEVVQGRSASDPVKAFDTDKLRNLIKALSQDPA